MPSDVRTHREAMAISAVWLLKQQADQWDRRDSLEIDPHEWSQFIFDKGMKEKSGEKTVFSTNADKTNGHSRAKERKNVDTLLHCSRK